MLRRVALVRTDVLEECITSNNYNSKLRLSVTVNVVHSWLILVTLMMEVIYFSGTLVLKRGTRRNIPVDGILHDI
jgi:heme O synthase-like polyprenyltransferase